MDSPKDATSTFTDSSKRRLHRSPLWLNGRCCRPENSLHIAPLSCWPLAALKPTACEHWHMLIEDPANVLCCSDARKSCRRVPLKPRMIEFSPKQPRAVSHEVLCCIAKPYTPHRRCSIQLAQAPYV